MTDNVIDYTAIRARLNAASEGPWEACTTGSRSGDHWYVCDEGEAIAHISTQDGINEDQRQPDAEFIAHSRTDLEQLLDRVEALEGIYAAVQSVHYMIHVGETRPVRLRVCAHCSTPWPCQTIRVIEANSTLAAVPAAGEETT